MPVEQIDHRPLSSPQKIAILIDLPGMFLAGIGEAILFPGHDEAGLLASTLIVPFVWYGIGRWIDGLLGYVGRLRLPRIMRGMSGLPLAFILCVSIAGLTPIYHHRTTDSYWVFTGLIVWSALGLAIILSSTQPVGSTTNGNARRGGPSLL